MAEITASLVKELREKTGAGMMDCKKALGETGGDLEQAVDWLRKKGLAAAAKKASRVASEGLIGIAVEGGKGALVEVNAETDFVGRNDKFQDFVRTVARLALAVGDDVEALKAAAYPGTGRTVADELTALIATIGENMSLRRVAVREAGVLGSYLHSAVAPGLGKIGVLLALDGGDAKTPDVAKQVAMHIAAAAPMSVSRDDLDPTAIERERQVLIGQAKESGKADAIIEKMVEGRIRKFYEEVCLLDQVYVIDGESRVSKILEGVGKPKVLGFDRFKLGEGLEKKQDDFAAEVAAMAK
ncbi:MAG: translation elongation factor Ts [Magnetospirillum sp. WYHS-4]